MNESPLDNAPPDNAELVRLIQAHCDGTLDASAGERLHAALLDNRAAQQLFLEQLDLHAQLQWQFGAGMSVAEEGEPAVADSQLAHSLNSPLSGTSRWGRPGPLHVAAALVLLVVIGLAAASVSFPWLDRPGAGEQAEHGAPRAPDRSLAVLAQVTQCLAARWGDTETPVEVGEDVVAGRLELYQGIVEITFVSGARILLEAPAELKIADPLHVFLLSGRVVAHTPATAAGFTIETERSRVVDLGTEFGLMTGPQGEMLVQVFDGVVTAEVKGEQGTMERLTAGQTRSLAVEGGRLTEQPFVEDRFIRRLPTPERRQGPDPPYNNSQHETVHIWPVQPQVTIDGDPGEWTEQGRFHSACRPPYDKSYCMWGQMAYDKQFLYLAAHVADPSPLRNRLDSLTEPRFFWAGGSVVVRLCTNRRMPYPLESVPQSQQERRRFYQESSNQFAHLALWHSHKDEQSHLTLRYGMDFRDAATDPPGWRGGFRRDDDGRGYVLEYAIPWSLLNAGDDPPQPGDDLAAVWHVHWSDEHGRSCFGQLIEVTNPAQQPYSFLNPGCWGRARYHGAHP